MAEWIEQASQWHELYCHDLEVMSSNPGRLNLGRLVLLSSVVLEPNISLNHWEQIRLKLVQVCCIFKCSYEQPVFMSYMITNVIVIANDTQSSI